MRILTQDTAPDVYESNPSTEPAKHDASEASDDEVAPPPDGLERTPLDPHGAKSRFRAAPPSEVHEASESPLARLLRLQDEAAELEVALSADRSRSEHQGAVRLLERLQRLQQRAASEVPPLDAAETVSLIQQLGTHRPDADGARDASGAPAPSPAPPTSELALRLLHLEQIIGTPDQDEGVAPLVSTLARLESQVQLLTQPRHLDAIVHRAKLASSELERVAENRKRMASHEEVPSETLAQVESLHALQSQIEPLVPLAPALLARLQALAPLHASASAFASQVSELEQAQRAHRARTDELRTMLERAQASLDENVAVSQRNLASLQARLAAVEEQLPK